MKLTSLGIYAATAVALQAGTLLGPSAYTQQSNSPFAAEILYGSVVLENFEDGLLNVPRVTASTGAVVGPGGLTDSVDGDDGVVDGSGTNGKSFFSGDGPTGIRFTFTGTLPTRAGLVWTDAGAGATVFFQAFDQNGVSLGVYPTHVADNSNVGETAEDRFFGAINNTGISSIFVSNSSGGIEIDHLQFGVAVPEPSTGLLSLGAGVLLGVYRKSRKAQLP